MPINMYGPITKKNNGRQRTWPFYVIWFSQSELFSFEIKKISENKITDPDNNESLCNGCFVSYLLIIFTPF